MNIFKASYLIFSILFFFQSPSFTLRAESIVAADIVEGTKTSKNYLKAKSHFEKTANGWNGYDDGAATRPVNGTGGATITTTCTRTTSSPLSGVGSLIMTKGAANYQGEGCSVDFTVDTKDKAKVLQVEFDYIVSSGTFTAGTSSTDSDVIVYLYDVDNSTLIEPTSIKLLSSSTTIADKFIGNFQTSSSGVNYRLMFHIASSTNTSSMVLKFDDIKISPSSYVYGTPISDWQSYTPVFTAMGTVTGINFQSRKVGDSLQTRGRFTMGTGTGSQAQMTLGYAGASANVTIDSTKLSNIQLVGMAGYSPAFDRTMYVLGEPSTSYVTFSAQSGGVFAQLSGSSLASSTEIISVEFQVPITGWSSSVQQSDSYSGREIAASYSTSVGTSVNGTAAAIPFATKNYDTTNSWNGSDTYTIPSSGKYSINSMLTYAYGAYTAGHFIEIYVYKNGASVAGASQGAATSASNYITSQISVDLDCVAGDTIKIYARNDATRTLNTAVTNNYFNIKKLSSPTTISATETVAFSANTSVSAVSTSAPFVFTTVSSDTHGAYSTSTGKFTAPVPGFYFFTATYYCGSATVQGVFYKNGSTSIAQGTGTVANSQAGTISYGVQLISGDTIELRSGAVTGTAEGGALVNHFTGFKVK
jgi:hypothetical protein